MSLTFVVGAYILARFSNRVVDDTGVPRIVPSLTMGFAFGMFIWGMLLAMTGLA